MREQMAGAGQPFSTMCTTSIIHRSGRPSPGQGLKTLPGRKLIFTNGTWRMPRRCWRASGFAGMFAGIFDIVHPISFPSPQLEPYEKFVAVHAIEPHGGDVRGHCAQI